MLPEDFHIELLKSDSTEIYICRFAPFDPENYLDYLTGDEQERMYSFVHPARRMEFAATRILRHQVFGYAHIHYDPHGAPFIEGEGFISISHSRNAVGLAVNRDFRVGLDLECPRHNIVSISPKFLSIEEPGYFDTRDPLVLTKIWSAKETLYKLAGRKKIHFKTELLLSMDEDGSWIGRIVNPDCDILVKLNIFELNDLIVSLNATPIVEVIRNI